MTEDGEEAILVCVKELEQAMYIKYSIIFPNSITQDSSALDSVLALFDLGSEGNAMYPAFAKKLALVL